MGIEIAAEGRARVGLRGHMIKSKHVIISPGIFDDLVVYKDVWDETKIPLAVSAVSSERKIVDTSRLHGLSNFCPPT